MTELTREPDATSSPALRFGAELRRQRRSRGWSQIKLARLLGCSHGWISLIERGKRTCDPHFAVKADEVFDTGGTFVELYRRIKSAALLEGFEEFTDCETRCRRLRTFELGVLPGLFQTQRYAAAMEAAAVERGSITQAQADERVSYLAARQRRVLEQQRPPVVHAVMCESCLHRPVGGPEVMAEQFDHLEALARRPHITVQVAPFSLAEQRPFLLPVVLLTLPDHSVVGYAESQLRGHLERGRNAIAALERDYDQLQVEALSKTASLAMIRAARKDLE